MDSEYVILVALGLLAVCQLPFLGSGKGGRGDIKADRQQRLWVVKVALVRLDCWQDFLNRRTEGQNRHRATLQIDRALGVVDSEMAVHCRPEVVW